MRKRKDHKPPRIRSGRRGGVECGGTIIGLEATTKNEWWGGMNRIHTLYRFYDLSWERESKRLLFVSQQPR